MGLTLAEARHNSGQSVPPVVGGGEEPGAWNTNVADLAAQLVQPSPDRKSIILVAPPTLFGSREVVMRIAVPSEVTADDFAAQLRAYFLGLLAGIAEDLSERFHLNVKSQRSGRPRLPDEVIGSALPAKAHRAGEAISLREAQLHGDVPQLREQISKR